MEAKKTFGARLDNKRSLFFNIGLIISLTLVFNAFEWKSYDKVVVKEVAEKETEFEEMVPITDIPEPPPPPKPKVIVREFIESTEPEIDIEEIEIVIDQDEVYEFEAEDFVAPEKPEEEVIDEPFLIVEEMPTPVGGFSEFYQFVANNITYPTRARSMQVEGKVFVQFIVDKEGYLTNVEAIKGIGAGCDEEAVRVVKSFPKWNPGKQRGIPVRVRMIIPIKFALYKNTQS